MIINVCLNFPSVAIATIFKVTTESWRLGADDWGIFLDAFQQNSELTFILGFIAWICSLNPTASVQIVTLTEVIYLVTLVLDSYACQN